MRSLLVALASLSLLPACLDCGDPKEEAALETAKSQFANANLASYSVTWTESCFCDTGRTRATRISVTGDAITRAVYVDDQTATKNSDIRTIDGVFDWIQGGFDKHYDSVHVAYDPSIGYPMTLFFDPDQNASDEETQVTFSNFTTPADAH